MCRMSPAPVAVRIIAANRHEANEWDRSRNRRQFRSGEQRHSRSERAVSGEVSAYPTLGSARSEVRGATSRPRMWRGEAWHGRADQAFEFGEPGRAGWGHRQFLAADHRGPLQDDQAVKTKLLTGSCLRILDQGLGSTRARCSRNRPLEPLCTMARLAQGWAGHPCHTRRMRLTSTGTPAPDVDALSLGHALGESEMLNLLHIARSFAKTRCPWFLSPSNKTLATAPFPSGMVGRFPEAPIS